MNWTRGPIIGRGSSAVVSLAATNTTGDHFAVKSSDLSSSNSLQKEEHLLSQLCSPFVIKSLGSDITYENNKHVYNLFLEYLPGGTLSDLIRKRGGSLDEDAIRFHAFQILQGLNYLHGKGLVHCDIKGQNILVVDDGGLRIADFGCARWSEYSGGSASISGTPAYMAPEVARGEEQGFPADIWAVGCTVIEMATGCNPWPEMKDPASALYRIGYSGDVPEFPGWFSGDAMDFLRKCLMRDWKERWTAAELLQHRFFTSVEQSCEQITRKSPTSVMDQGFWDAFEVSDCSENPAETALSSDSPAVRIRALLGDDASWTEEEEEWLTVRGDEIQERLKKDQDFEDFVEECLEIQDRNQEFEDLIGAESVTFEEEDIESLILTEDCFNGDRSSTLAVTHSEGVKYLFLYSELLISEDMLMELSLHKDHLFLQLFIPFLSFFVSRHYFQCLNHLFSFF